MIWSPKSEVMFEMKSIRFLNGLMLLVIVIAVLLGSAFMLRKGEYIHYKGGTVITTEQYAQVVAENRIVPRKDYNYIELVDDDSSVVYFVYDFNVYNEDDTYGFLAQPDRGILDNPALYSVGRVFKETFRETWYVMLIMAGVFGGLYFVMIKKPRYIMRGVKWARHFIESRYYSKIKDIKGNVTTDVNTISLGGSSGIICVRCWEVDRSGCLKSVGRGTKWDTKELYAGGMPEKDGLSGVHAYRLGTYPRIKSKVLGIVELNGKYEYHVDGVVRAEHCKIYGFFMSKGYKRMGNYLSRKYGLPIYFSDSPEQGYLKWLYSKNGIEAINHNYEILKGD